MQKDFQRINRLYEDFTNAIVETGAIKEIPYFGQFVKYAEHAQNISNCMFIKKLARFVEDIQSVTDGDLKQIKLALEHSPEKELAEKIILAVDSLYDLSKTKYIAQALHLYSQLELTKADFLRTLDLIQKLYAGDLAKLETFNWISGVTNDDLEYYGLSSLIGTPILKIEHVSQRMLTDEGRHDELGLVRFTQSNFGYIFLSVLKNRKPYTELQKKDLERRGEIKEFIQP